MELPLLRYPRTCRIRVILRQVRTRSVAFLYYVVDPEASGAFSPLADSSEANQGSLPLLRAKRTPANTVKVKAEMSKGRTYPLIRSAEMPPATNTVATNITSAATSVARIESRTVLWSSAKAAQPRVVVLKSIRWISPEKRPSSTIIRSKTLGVLGDRVACVVPDFSSGTNPDTREQLYR